MLVPVSRLIAMLMAGILCFGILVPMSLARHNVALAIFISIVFIAYLIANVVLWQRMRPRA
jgi:predicted lipid-binding transport protein (Tim44 family)